MQERATTNGCPSIQNVDNRYYSAMLRCDMAFLPVLVLPVPFLRSQVKGQFEKVSLRRMSYVQAQFVCQDVCVCARLYAGSFVKCYSGICFTVRRSWLKKQVYSIPAQETAFQCSEIVVFKSFFSIFQYPRRPTIFTISSVRLCLVICTVLLQVAGSV